jgi:transcriptional regulator with XRE-family HTH domain
MYSSLISKIETNTVGPSLSTLHLVAQALGTSISALFAMEESSTEVVCRQEERPIAGKVQSMSEWDGIEAEIAHRTSYATAMACIILQLPNNYLPILQK